MAKRIGVLVMDDVVVSGFMPVGNGRNVCEIV